MGCVFSKKPTSEDIDREVRNSLDQRLNIYQDSKLFQISDAKETALGDDNVLKGIHEKSRR